jgi:peptidyl-dipeptidase A
MVKAGERFYTSLGLDPLPATFWQRSMFVKPGDHQVGCRPTAWDLDAAEDLRISMCAQPTQDDLLSIHRELGHAYYARAYAKLPPLYQQGASAGFQEALGDALTLSMTPQYMKELGLLAAVPRDDKGLVNQQMKEALTKVAFLPFALVVDQWRWDVFSGKTKPADYNKAWWALRRRTQGVAPPAPRTEDDFDAGAAYQVSANVPDTRFVLAEVLEFQMHRALCRAAGQTGPLYQCSIYGSQEAGKALARMMALGASEPWPEALAALSGERRIDASAMVEYFSPLATWLKQQNEGRRCGW